jgi:hypothetical protein
MRTVTRCAPYYFLGYHQNEVIEPHIIDIITRFF